MAFSHPGNPLSYRDRLTIGVVLTLLFGLMLVVQGCCSPQIQKPNWHAESEYKSAVMIQHLCPMGGGGYGTGVIVGPQTILTAYHVVDCEDEVGSDADSAIEIHMSPVIITVKDSKGAAYIALVDTVVPGLDIAKIRILFGDLSPEVVTVGPRPALGDRACEMSVIPRETYRCGEIQTNSKSTIRIGMFIESGNSGSPVFVDGKLVGLTVTTGFCQGEVRCYGGITPLQGMDWLVGN